MKRNAKSARKRALAALVVLAVAVSGCSGTGSTADRDATADSGTTAASSSAVAPDLQVPYGVGRVHRTFVDRSRPTPASAGHPKDPDRTIETTVLYPATGEPGDSVVDDASPARQGRPFPFVVLAHGLGGSEEHLTPLAVSWAAAGYVVALPRFPLTYATTPGGVDGADVQNQPGDVSFVIDEVLAESNGTGTTLAGLVDPEAIGLAGHSNGAITTLGAVANTCCREERIRAAIVLAGTPSPYADGTYDFGSIPPILFVHGVNDRAVSYDQTVQTYNRAATPKALLTLERADHGEWFLPENEAFEITVRATTDFLDGYLRGDRSAIGRLGSDGAPPVATMHFSPDDASETTVATAPVPETNRHASVSADTGLRDGQVVTVTWSGFLPNKTVNVLQCVGDGRGGTASCGLAEGHVLVPDPTGSGSVDLTVHTGAFANGTCDAQHPCTILVNDSGLLDEDAFVYFPVTFSP
ncbi:MAG: hypothetical protein K1X38_11235 [Microthrixaceae bacterium]|nr:hypothetical protein [Microthrixaceae bacterium]